MSLLNSRTPTMKRIQREALELTKQPSPDFTAFPLETNLFEWHFTLRGPPAPSPYANGIYHGRIILPPSYPLRPPSFRFLTPSGRFEVNREICLSISGHHEETWQPAWGIRTALVAIRSFMDTDAKGQVGGVDTNNQVRERFASDSRSWKCSCSEGKSNEQVMNELEESCQLKEADSNSKSEESVPEELRLAYRDELHKDSTAAQTGDMKEKQEKDSDERSLAPPGRPGMTRSSSAARSSENLQAKIFASHNADERARADGSTPPTRGTSTPVTQSTSASPPRQQAQQAVRQTPQARPAETTILDAAIAAVAAVLLILIIRKIVHYL